MYIYTVDDKLKFHKRASKVTIHDQCMDLDTYVIL